MRWKLSFAALMIAAGPAWALPATVPDSAFPAIQPSGIVANLVPFTTLPATSAAAPIARPQYVTALPDGRMFVNDIGNVLYQAVPGGTATPYLNLAAQNVGAITAPASNAQGPGFASVAFHPNFDGDPTQPGYGKFYTVTNIANPGTSTLGNGAGSTSIEIREWTATDPTASTFSGTSRVVMDISGYIDAHSGGMIAFNPTAKPGDADYGNLYFGSGDGLSNDGNQNAQNLGVPQGKILRIDPLQGPAGQAYTVPADNPFVSTAGALPEVWAYGLRFPQSFGWDSVTGTMYINDIGQAALEEVDVGTAGANYGWSQREGTYATGYAYGQGVSDQNIYPVPVGTGSGFTDPIAQFFHADGDAIGSGFLYRESDIPALYGKYVMADIVTGRIFVFDPAAATNGALAPVTELNLVQNGQSLNLLDTYGYDKDYDPRVDARLSLDPNGELLLALKSTGAIYALEAAPIPEPGAGPVLAGALVLAALRLNRPLRLNRSSAPPINPA